MGLGASVKELPLSSFSLSLPPGKLQQGRPLGEQWWSSVEVSETPRS